MRVAVLLGGTSAEREVSLASGHAAAAALAQAGFEVTEVDTQCENPVAAILQARPEVCFIALHGKDGEDGAIQGALEILNIPYTGSGVLASALAMDKVRAKQIYEANGLPTPKTVVATAGQPCNLAAARQQLGPKLVVKPSNEGSALGVTIVESEEEMAAAIEHAFQHDSQVLIEQFIAGTEVTIAVLGTAELQALPVIEIVPQESSAFYDYEAKYQQGGARHIIPARISEELTQRCQQLAIQAHQALGCFGVSRSDIIIDEAGECWLLETNTIPGLTATSLLPDAAQHAGIPFPQLCRLLVEQAFEK